MKICGYGRVSSMGQLDGTSLEDQRARIEAKAKQDEHELIDLYFDGGVSGGSLDRPELMRLRENAAKGRFEAVYFTKLDRLGRSLRDVSNLFFEFEQLGISLICLDDPGLNISGKMGKVMRGILSSFAEFEKDMIAERTAGGRATRWASGGMPLGDNHLPLGYRKNEKSGKPEIVESEAAIYRQIISFYMDSRLSMKEIAIRLTREGIPSPSAIKKAHLDEQRKTKKPNSVMKRKRPAAQRWNNTTISNILKNPAYKGEALYNKAVYDLRKGGSNGEYKRIGKDEKPRGEWIKIPFPPLISEALWEQIQNRIKTQVHKPKRIYKCYEDHFLLDGLIFCGECGSRMRKQVQILKSGKTLLHYTCYWQSCGEANRELSGRAQCIFKPIEAESTDAAIYSQIIELLTRPETFVKT
jgi:site-specific DNA recombinase